MWTGFTPPVARTKTDEKHRNPNSNKTCFSVVKTRLFMVLARSFMYFRVPQLGIAWMFLRLLLCGTSGPRIPK